MFWLSTILDRVVYVRTEKGVVFEVKHYMFSFQGHISCSQESCVSLTHAHPNPFIIFLYGVKKSAFICCLVGLFFVVIVQLLLHGKCSAAATENLCCLYIYIYIYFLLSHPHVV